MTSAQHRQRRVTWPVVLIGCGALCFATLLGCSADSQADAKQDAESKLSEVREKSVWWPMGRNVGASEWQILREMDGLYEARGATLKEGTGSNDLIFLLPGDHQLVCVMQRDRLFTDPVVRSAEGWEGVDRGYWRRLLPGDERGAGLHEPEADPDHWLWNSPPN